MRCRSGSAPAGSPPGAGRAPGASPGGTGTGRRSPRGRSAQAHSAAARPSRDSRRHTSRRGAVEMIVRADRERVSSSVSMERLTALARALTAAAQSEELAGALDKLAEAARIVAGADVGLVRVRTAGGRLEAVAVAGPRALAAELEGMQLPEDAVPDGPVQTFASAP